jgi:hypothetical protein
MSKPRILFLISFNFPIRYLLRTGFLESVKDFCEPVVCLAWEQKDLCLELEDLGIEYLIENSIIPNNEIINIRNEIDTYYKLKISKNYFFKNVRKLNRRNFGLKKRIKFEIKLLKDRLFYSKSKYTFLKNKEKILIESQPYFNEFSTKLQNINIQGVFTVSAYLFFEEVICRIANKLSIPVYYSVLSFDNLSNRGQFSFEAKAYFVWNEINKKEIENLIKHQENKSTISIVGVPQFDFYYKGHEFAKNSIEWKREKGISENRPVILYGANSKYFISNEKNLIREIDIAITNGIIVNSPIILVRPHPTDSIVDWVEFAKNCKNVIIEKSIDENESVDGINNKYSNFTINDVIKLTSSLANSDVHINIGSTMALDGASFNKPIICPYFSPNLNRTDNKIIRGFYWSDHYKAISQSGGIALPKNYTELFKELNIGLLTPEKNSEKRLNMLQNLISNLDGNSTDKLANSFKKSLISKQN